jgi:urea-proton symporter
MQPAFSATQGIVLLAAFAAGMWGLTWLFARELRTKELFLVAGRNVGLGMASFSIAAAWVWAPSMFVAAQKAYQEGVAGLFWFTVPNVLCLMVFAPFARIIRDRVPEGYTLSDYMRQRHGNGAHGAYLFQLGGLTLCAFAVQLLAGGKVIAWLTGMPYGLVTVVLSLIALSYSFFSGLRASLVTDYAKMIFILLAGLCIAPWAVARAGGLDTLVAGLGGASGRYRSLFGSDGLHVALTFGIPTTIGLLAGPFGDQAFWQRAFATEKKSVARAFVQAALLFAMVPLLMSLLGFVAAGSGYELADASLANVETVRRLLPGWALAAFCAILLCGLVSTLDSKLCALSGLVGHDAVTRWGRDHGDRRTLAAARLGMVALAVCGTLVANIPHMEILYLFLFYGTLRSATLLPTVITLLSSRVDGRGVGWGVLVSIVVGLPIFAYGNFAKQPTWIVAGSLTTVLASGVITLVASRMRVTAAGRS